MYVCTYLYMYVYSYICMYLHLCYVYILKLRLKLLSVCRLTAVSPGNFYFFTNQGWKCVVHSTQEYT